MTLANTNYDTCDSDMYEYGLSLAPTPLPSHPHTTPHHPHPHPHPHPYASEASEKHQFLGDAQFKKNIKKY
jgi:hypothetical protein